MFWHYQLASHCCLFVTHTALIVILPWWFVLPGFTDSVGFSLFITVRICIGHGDLGRLVLLIQLASHCYYIANLSWPWWFGSPCFLLIQAASHCLLQREFFYWPWWFGSPCFTDSGGFSLFITVRICIGLGDLGRHVLLIKAASHCLLQWQFVLAMVIWVAMFFWFSWLLIIFTVRFCISPASRQVYCVVRFTVSVGFSLRFDNRSDFFVLDLVLKVLPGFTVSVGFSPFITVTVLYCPGSILFEKFWLATIANQIPNWLAISDIA